MLDERRSGWHTSFIHCWPAALIPLMPPGVRYGARHVGHAGQPLFLMEARSKEGDRDMVKPSYSLS